MFAYVPHQMLVCVERLRAMWIQSKAQTLVSAVHGGWGQMIEDITLNIYLNPWL